MDSKVLLMLVMVELYIQQHTIPLNHIPFLKHHTVALHFLHYTQVPYMKMKIDDD